MQQPLESLAHDADANAWSERGGAGALDARRLRFILQDHAADPAPADSAAAIEAFLYVDPSVLDATAAQVFACYRRCMPCTKKRHALAAIHGPAQYGNTCISA